MALRFTPSTMLATSKRRSALASLIAALVAVLVLSILSAKPASADLYTGPTETPIAAVQPNTLPDVTFGFGYDCKVPSAWGANPLLYLWAHDEASSLYAYAQLVYPSGTVNVLGGHSAYPGNPDVISLNGLADGTYKLIIYDGTQVSEGVKNPRQTSALFTINCSGPTPSSSPTSTPTTTPSPTASSTPTPSGTPTPSPTPTVTPTPTTPPLPPVYPALVKAPTLTRKYGSNVATFSGGSFKNVSGVYAYVQARYGRVSSLVRVPVVRGVVSLKGVQARLWSGLPWGKFNLMLSIYGANKQPLLTATRARLTAKTVVDAVPHVRVLSESFKKTRHDSHATYRVKFSNLFSLVRDNTKVTVTLYRGRQVFYYTVKVRHDTQTLTFRPRVGKYASSRWWHYKLTQGRRTLVKANGLHLSVKR